jgi:Na+/melibiose symporter-like transporter
VAYGQFAWVFVGVLAVGLIMTLWGAPKPQPAPPGALERWREALAPTAIRRLLWFYLFNATSVAVPATLVLFVMDDALGLQESGGVFLGLYFLAGMVALPGWVALSDRIGKERAWLAGALLASCALLLTAWLEPGDVTRWAIVCLLSGAALGADVALPPAMLADAIGPAHRKSTGLYFGLWALVGKLSLALAAGLALPLVRFLGYQPGDATTSDPLTAVYSFLPVALKVAAAVALWSLRRPLTLTCAGSRTGSLP